MSWRFRKSINLGGVKVNLSKSGVGMSVGGKGFRAGIGPKGPYQSMGIPGTGLYSVNYASSGSKNAPARTPAGSVPVSSSVGFEQMPSHGALGLGTMFKSGCLFFTPLPMLIFGWKIAAIAAAVILLIYLVEKKSDVGKEAALYSGVLEKVSTNRYEEAVAGLHELSQRPKPAAGLHLALGYCYLKSGQREQALNEYRGYVEKVPSDTATAVRFAGYLIEENRLEEALAILDRMPPLPSLGLILTWMKGMCLLGLERPALAIEVLKTAPLRQKLPDPTLTSIRYTLGRAYELSGNRERAAALFRRVYADNANYQGIQDALARVEGVKTPDEPEA